MIVQSWVDDFNFLSVRRGEHFQGQHLVLPDIMQQPFHPYFSSVNVFCETKVRKFERKALLLHENY